MGYTHYWSRPPAKEHDLETWEKFVADCKFLYKNMPKNATCYDPQGCLRNDPLLLNGCSAFKNPQFTNARVYFNGTGTRKRIKKEAFHNGKKMICWDDDETNIPEENRNLGHETCVLTRKIHKDSYKDDSGAVFGFCKTARKPYDLMVTACLILYKQYFPYVEVSSDGDNEDWKPAFLFIADVLPDGHTIATEMLLTNNLFEKLYK